MKQWLKLHSIHYDAEIRVTVNIPYKENTWEAIKRIMKLLNMRVVFSSLNTIGRQFIRLQDEWPMTSNSNFIYKVNFKDCPANYTGMISRSLKEIDKHWTLCTKVIKKKKKQQPRKVISNWISCHQRRSQNRLRPTWNKIDQPTQTQPNAGSWTNDNSKYWKYL